MSRETLQKRLGYGVTGLLLGIVWRSSDAYLENKIGVTALSLTYSKLAQISAPFRSCRDSQNRSCGPLCGFLNYESLIADRRIELGGTPSCSHIRLSACNKTYLVQS